MKILHYIDVNNALRCLGAVAPLLPATVPCIYCNEDAKANLDHSLDTLVVSCEKCQTAYSLFEALMRQATLEDEFDASILAQYINKHKILRIKATEDIVLSHFDKLAEFDKFKALLSHLQQLAAPFFSKLTNSLAAAWQVQELDETHWFLIKDHFFPIMTEQLLEAVPDISGRLLHDRLMVGIPFYTSPYIPCGILFAGLNSSLYFSSIAFLGEAGIGGNPDVYLYRQFHKLLDSFSFYVRDPRIFVGILSSVLCAAGVVPAVGLVYKGLGQIGTIRRPLETVELPSTGRISLVIDRMTSHSIRLVLSSGGNLGDPRSFKLNNAVRLLLFVASHSLTASSLLNVLKAKSKLHIVKNNLTILSLTDQFDIIKSTQLYQSLENKIEALSNHELIINNKKVKITKNGIIVDNKQVSNYIPFLQLRSARYDIFEVYSLGRIFRAKVKRTWKQSLIGLLETEVNRDILGTALVSRSQASGLLLAVAKQLGKGERLYCQPHISPGVLRLRQHCLMFGAAPQEVTVACIGPNTSFEYDLEAIIAESPQLPHLVAVVALAGIPILRMCGAAPYSIVVANKTLARSLFWLAPRAGLYTLKAATLEELRAKVVKSVRRHWITVAKVGDCSGDMTVSGCVLLNNMAAARLWDFPWLLLDIPPINANVADKFRGLFYNVLCLLIKEGTSLSDFTATPMLLVARLFEILMRKFEIKGDAVKYVENYVYSIIGKWDNVNQLAREMKLTVQKIGYKGEKTIPRDVCKKVFMDNVVAPSAVIDYALDKLSSDGVVNNKSLPTSSSNK